MKLDFTYQLNTGHIAERPRVQAYTLSGIPSGEVEATVGVDVYYFLTQFVRQVSGVTSVRVLPKSKRGYDYHKVFIVTDRPDIDRDRKLVELMGQLDSVDYDLVPTSAAGMIPDGAHTI
jgi:hypothetical protein